MLQQVCIDANIAIGGMQACRGELLVSVDSAAISQLTLHRESVPYKSTTFICMLIKDMLLHATADMQDVAIFLLLPNFC